jgi:hypothetical protein
MKNASEAASFEARWPVLLVILAEVALLVLLSSRIRILPVWVPYILFAMVLIPMIAVQLTRGKVVWLGVERVTTLIFVVVAAVVTLAGLASVIHLVLSGSTELSGEQLLSSSLAAWVTNVLVFSLLYWQIDRGSPEARVRRTGSRPDWVFPQEDASEEDVGAGWRPTYIDYLFLSFSTATAFSTTDTVPMKSRAKMLMMLEAAISLVTITAVASRAINILGS